MATNNGGNTSFSWGPSPHATFSFGCCKRHFALGGQGSFQRICSSAGAELPEQPPARSHNSKLISSPFNFKML